MKEFMLIYSGGDPEMMKNTSQQDMAAAMARWGAWMGGLQEKGQLSSGGSPLQYPGKRLKNDGVVTDISASEFKELVTGYSIVKANDINEAVSMAQDCPVFDQPDTTVEVREVMILDM